MTTRQAEWRRRNRAAGKCLCGAEPTDGYKTCGRCREQKRVEVAGYRERLAIRELRNRSADVELATGEPRR